MTEQETQDGPPVFDDLPPATGQGRPEPTAIQGTPMVDAPPDADDRPVVPASCGTPLERGLPVWEVETGRAMVVAQVYSPVSVEVRWRELDVAGQGVTYSATTRADLLTAVEPQPAPE